MNNIRKMIEDFQTEDPREQSDKTQFLKFIDTFDDILTRDNTFGHFAASAFILNSDHTKTLLIHHNIFNGYIFPGGHADGDKNLLNVAIREAKEETGLDVHPPSNQPIAISCDSIVPHIKHGKHIPAHNHYNVIYLFDTDKKDESKIRIKEDENSDIKWVDLNQCLATNLVPLARPSIENILKKIAPQINATNHTTKRRAFLALKFYDGTTSKPIIDGITNALAPLGIETFCVARDIEKYGTVKGLDYANFMPKYAFPNIEKSDLMIVEFSEKGVGLGIGACHAYDSHIPLYIIAKTGSDISPTINSLATKVIYYDNYDDLTKQFKQII